MGKYEVNFDSPPPLGTVVRGRMLVTVEPYRRVDGTNSYLLRWSCCNGAEYTSGLNGNFQRTRRKLRPEAAALL